MTFLNSPGSFVLFQSYILDASRSSVMQLSSSPILGYFCIISAPTETPAWLWKSQAAASIATCYARASTKAKNSNKTGLRPFLYTSVLQQQPMKNRAFHTPLLYIIPSLPHPVSADYFWIRYRGKMVFSILVHVHELHLTRLTQNPPQIYPILIFPN